MPFHRPIMVLVLLLLAGALLWPRLGGDDSSEVRRSRLLLGTVVEITALGPDRSLLEGAVSDAFAEMERIEKLMSPHIESSDVARLSKAGTSQPVSAETATVLRLGLHLAAQSDGAFDLTLGRLKELWGIEGESPQVPDSDSVADALRGIGPEALRLEAPLVIKSRPELQIDLGGIAKGYAIDRAIFLLADAGIEFASVNAGGDMRLLGDRGGERPWRIGIQHPRDSQRLLTTLEVEDVSVVTSGDYERYFEQEGRRYHHLFDPRTGYPATACRSVTVVAPSAMLADALATALFVLGPEQGMSLLQLYPEAEALIVDSSGKEHQSANFAEYRL
ncbi:MAG TPA: FAD:protein FMN transferase [Geoalkalibacter subterraneus]|uniref:FAD:protein FMN transferase n=1 Tax=Geoalkalibacter subterraneus TaxID=483547 RepID=A0A831LSM9_9BACT|nr:FAD:protein FMN transferase [Geoalkalibacter subterraneus]